jgi:hypothetical protein
MSIYVYPTDLKWFQFLQLRSPLDEVNFWQPGGTTKLQEEALFLMQHCSQLLAHGKRLVKRMALIHFMNFSTLLVIIDQGMELPIQQLILRSDASFFKTPFF